MDDVEAVDLVTVFHSDKNRRQALELEDELFQHHGDDEHWTLIGVDNRIENRGFARGCNVGAADGKAPIIGFLNPDLRVKGEFLSLIRKTLVGNVQVTGSRFGKSHLEYQRIWGCHEWVCGACFFVRRDWWEKLGGFDERFVWGWEETDFIRRTQRERGLVVALDVPVEHESPHDDDPADIRYKNLHFNNGARLFYERWPLR